MAATTRSVFSDAPLPGRVRWGVAWTAALLIVLGVAGCGTGTAGGGHRSADTTVVTWFSSAVPTAPPPTTYVPIDPSAGEVRQTPTTNPYFPVLKELPVITLADVAAVGIGGSVQIVTDWPATPRWLSPAADREIVERLLSAYQATHLTPGDGSGIWPGHLTIIRRDGESVRFGVPLEGDRVAVFRFAAGPAGEGGERDYSQANATAPALAELARTLAAEPAPSAFAQVPPGLPAEMPADFGFFLQYGEDFGPRDVLDTFAGTLTKDLVADGSVTVDLRLSPEELVRIYQRMVQIGIEDYQNRRLGVTSGGRYGGTLWLRARAGGREFVISQMEIYVAPGPEQDPLLALVKEIRNTVQAREEYWTLPAARGTYGMP